MGGPQRMNALRRGSRQSAHISVMENDLVKTTLGSILIGLAISATAVGQTSGSDRAKQPGPANSDEIVLTFRGEIDGSDQMKITQTGATWHHSWGTPPGPVTLNGISWDPNDSGDRSNYEVAIIFGE